MNLIRMWVINILLSLHKYYLKLRRKILLTPRKSNNLKPSLSLKYQNNWLLMIVWKWVNHWQGSNLLTKVKTDTKITNFIENALNEVDL